MLKFDGMVKLRLKIMQSECLAVIAHSRVMCGPPHKRFGHLYTVH